MAQPTAAGPDTRKLGAGAIATIAAGGVLLVFIIQNREDVQIDFLAWSFTWPLWLYTIVVALFEVIKQYVTQKFIYKLVKPKVSALPAATMIQPPVFERLKV